MKNKRLSLPKTLLVLAVLLAIVVLRIGEEKTTGPNRKVEPPLTSVTPVMTGRVASVADGDSFKLRIKGRGQVGVRLLGIDAPEGRQSRGRQARKALRRYIEGQTVELKVAETDQYGRLVGDLYVNGVWVNEAMVADGWAWHYKRYSRSTALAHAEREARKRHRGLWRDKDPTPPWIWRRQNPR